MNFLSDVITYVRRIIKTPSNAQITDNLIIDYINRFWLMDVDARVQLFDLKTTYSFQTVPGRVSYNMPLYDTQTQPGGQLIAPFPVYQGFLGPCYINGVQVAFYTTQESFYNVWPNVIQQLPSATIGDGGSTYSFYLPYSPAIPGHVDMAGIIATGVNVDPPIGSTFNTSIPTTSVQSAVYITTQDSTGANVVVADSGQFLQSNQNYGLLMRPGNAPYGNSGLNGGYSITSNVVNYQTGQVYVTFTDANGAPINIPAGQPINAQCYYYQPGLPRGILYYNNTITLRNPPNTQYKVDLTGYLTPAAFLSTAQALPFAYMAEYIARGAARKILSDTGDVEQFNFYEPLFREQEMLVWKRSQRQFTSTRTGTIYSEYQGPTAYNTAQGNT